MSKKIEEDFKAAYQDFIRKPRIEKHIAMLLRKEKKLKKQSKVLEAFMHKEFLDIEKMEKKGLKSTFKSFLGTLQDALDKERQEYLLAVLNFQANEKEIVAVEFAIKVLQRKLIELGNVENRFTKIKSKYFISLNTSKAGKGKKVKKIKEQLISQNSKLAELRQAKKMAEKSEEALVNLKSELAKIDYWGFHDKRIAMTYSGKGRYSSSKKKRYIDRTKSLTFRVNGILNRFNEELSDVSHSFKIDFSGEIESIQNFLNLFFDNLITDWIVKNEISVAFMALDMIHDKIARIVQMLDFEKERLVEMVNDLIRQETEIMLE